jgi:NAD(P)-dependent dehydrogenase (short-subunit alcohol dehydrogenase family)
MVAAAARDVTTLNDLASQYGDSILPIELNVTDRAAAFAAVQQAHGHFGRLDVVVNNGIMAFPGLGIYHASSPLRSWSKGSLQSYVLAHPFPLRLARVGLYVHSVQRDTAAEQGFGHVGSQTAVSAP